MIAAVARSLWSPSVAASVPSAATGRTSSPIQLLIADGVIEILDVPVGAFMLEADRRPHQAGAGRESELVRRASA